MHSFFTYMNNPQIVADFQKIFGLEWEFDVNNEHTQQTDNINNDISSSSSGKETNGSLTQLDENNNNEKWNSNGSVRSRKTDTAQANGHSNNVPQPLSSKSSSTSSSSSDHVVTNTDHSHLISKLKINVRFWYYFFHVGAAMGNEIFYSIFFPCWFWNVDGAIARKITMVWGIFMYIGQATKDLMAMPRPASPPVVKLEERYVLEYGFPSTHSMVACGLPLALVLLSYGRYNIDLTFSLCMSTVFCLWVCTSRMYLGMHSLLDVTAGVLYGLVVLVIFAPTLEPIDNFIMNYESAPWILFPLGLLICYAYPTVKRWSTTRSDTAIVVGTVVGFSIGSALNNYIGLLHKPDKPPLYDIRYPDAIGYFEVVVRTLLGMLLLVTTRQLFKPFWKALLCKVLFLNPDCVDSMRKKRIEIPSNYMTYLILGFNVTFTSPYIFRLLNIERDYENTEL